jgi:hypothetical protein
LTRRFGSSFGVGVVGVRDDGVQGIVPAVHLDDDEHAGVFVRCRRPHRSRDE